MVVPAPVKSTGLKFIPLEIPMIIKETREEHDDLSHLAFSKEDESSSKEITFNRDSNSKMNKSSILNTTTQ